MFPISANGTIIHPAAKATDMGAVLPSSCFSVPYRVNHKVPYPSICDILESSYLPPFIPSIAQFVSLFLTWWPPNSDICFLSYSLQVLCSYTEARIIFLNHQPPVLPCQFFVYWFCIVFTLISEPRHRIFLASYEEPHLPSSLQCTVYSNHIIWILISQTIRVAPVSPLFLLL